MIVINSMTNVSIPESLGVSVLGIIVVFLVLVFLMVIIYIMTAVYKKSSKKPATAAAAADKSVSSAPPPPADLPPAGPTPTDPVPDDPVPAAPASAEQTSAPVAAPEPSVPKKYRVIVNGMEYEVDAETGDSASYQTLSEPESPLVSVDAVPEAQAAPMVQAVLSSAQGQTFEFSGIRKFTVVVDGKEYEVDAEMGDPATKSGAEGSVTI